MSNIDRFQVQMTRRIGEIEDVVAGLTTIQVPSGSGGQGYDVKSYGAVGDGATDDTAAIQAAVTAAAGSEVFFPPGIYNISAPIDLTNLNGTILRGSGRAVTAIQNTNVAGGVAILTGPIRSLGIENMRISGAPAGGSGACIHISGYVTHVSLSHLYVENGESGVDLTGASGIDVVMIDVRRDSGDKGFLLATTNVLNQVTAINCYANQTNGWGWHIAGVANSVLIDCNADNNASGGYTLVNGVIVLIGCDAEVNSNYGYMVSGAGTYHFLGCRTYNQSQPFYINAAARVSIESCRTANTPSAQSILLGAAATLQTILGENDLDKPLYVNAAAVIDYRQGGKWSVGGGASVTMHLSGTATWNPANVAGGGYTSTTLTVTGAAVGNTVTVGFSIAVPAGCLLIGAVTSANTVTVTLLNMTASAVDLGSGTLRADVWVH